MIAPLKIIVLTWYKDCLQFCIDWAVLACHCKVFMMVVLWHGCYAINYYQDNWSLL